VILEICVAIIESGLAPLIVAADLPAGTILVITEKSLNDEEHTDHYMTKPQPTDRSMTTLPHDRH
jgi:hypothetical protein